MSVWPITKDWLEEILSEPVDHFSVTAGANSEDGYAGLLLSICVTFADADTDTAAESNTGTNKNTTATSASGRKKRPEFLLLKTFSSDPDTQNWLSKTNIFHKEFLVYKSFLSQLLLFQQPKPQLANQDTSTPKTNEGGHGSLLISIIPPVPQFIYGCAVDFTEIPQSDWQNYTSHVHNCIVMPDLRKVGFKMADRLRFEGLDWSHAKLVIEALAKLHALSWAYKCKYKLERLSDRLPCLQSTLFDSMTDDAIEKMFDYKYSVFRKILEKLPGDHGGERSKLLNSLERSRQVARDVTVLYFSRVKSLSHPSVTKNNVLRVVPDNADKNEETWLTFCHGDSWTNNFLFRYDDDGEPRETVVLDFQLAFEGDPMSDLAYLLYSNTTSHFRRQHLDPLLRVYTSTFTDICGALNVEPLPGFCEDEVQTRFHRAKACGFLGSILNLPLFLQRKEGEGGDEGLNPVLDTAVVELVRELYQQGVI